MLGPALDPDSGLGVYLDHGVGVGPGDNKVALVESDGQGCGLDRERGEKGAEGEREGGES